MRRLKGFWQLIRIVPVLSWSGASVAATGLPLIIHAKAPVSVCLIPFIGGLLVQGLLAHAVNDIVDDQSGTDSKSPALLSGGSRVIQNGFFSALELRRMILVFVLFALGIEFVLVYTGSTGLALILAIGLSASIFYSLPPRLSYRPFLGEWLCAFPAVVAIGLTPPLLYLHSLPDWAVLIAVDHALFSVAWLMVHHIPDVEADSAALPVKKTTVVWSLSFFGKRSAVKGPASLYFGAATLFSLLFLPQWPLAAMGSFCFAFAALIIVFFMKTNDLKKVTLAEILLMILSCSNALWIGILA